LAQLLYDIADENPVLLVDIHAMKSDDALLSNDRKLVLRTRNHYADTDILFETPVSSWFDAIIWLKTAHCAQDWLQ